MRTLSWYEKERLNEQLKFFDAKKTKFISIYAKKPRILMKEQKILFETHGATCKTLMAQRDASSDWSNLFLAQDAYFGGLCVNSQNQASTGSAGRGFGGNAGNICDGIGAAFGGSYV